jgi:hypothetical protein
MNKIEQLLVSQNDAEVKKGISLLKSKDDSVDIFDFHDELFDVAKNKTLSDCTRKDALELVTRADPSNDRLHYELVEIICLFNDDIAMKAAELIGECSNISDREVIEEIQECILRHNSIEVRQVLRDSVEELIDCGGIDERIENILENGIIDTEKHIGQPEEFVDAPLPREVERSKDKKYDIFISFASEERELIVLPLVSALRDSGISVWYDEDNIETADALIDKIRNGIDRSQCVLAVISPDYIKKKWTLREFREIIAIWRTCNILFIPLIHGISIEKIAEFSEALSNFKCQEVSSNNISDVVESVKSYLQRLKKKE